MGRKFALAARENLCLPLSDKRARKKNNLKPCTRGKFRGSHISFFFSRKSIVKEMSIDGEGIHLRCSLIALKN